MQSEHIRRRVQEEHERLRDALLAVEALARRVEAGDSGAVPELRQRSLELHLQLCEHLDLEDRLLLPVVERAGVWGTERARQLRREHAEQRLLLRYVLDCLRDEMRPKVVLARDLVSFVAVLRDDMEQEDRDLLCELARRRA